MRNEIARLIRQLQSLMETGSEEDFRAVVSDLKRVIRSDGMLRHFFDSLPDGYELLFTSHPHGNSVLNQILERDAQLFEATGITDDIKKLHMKDPIEIFLKLSQIRDILHDRVEAHFRNHPDAVAEEIFWNQYNETGCGGDFTYDRYDRLVKQIVANGLPQSILRCYADASGNQLKQGDQVEAVKEIRCLRSQKAIPLGTRLIIRELHYLENYVEANFKNEPWAFHGSQVLRTS